jgi:hypothetical protein
METAGEFGDAFFPVTPSPFGRLQRVAGETLI